MKSSWILAALCVALTSCGAVPGTRDLHTIPSPSNGYRGVFYAWAVPQEQLNQEAASLCAQYGGLRHPGVVPYGVQQYNFSCLGNVPAPQPRNVANPVASPPQAPLPRSSTEPLPNAAPSLSIEAAKQKCLDLGFKLNTEALGKCVLQLSQ